MANKTDNVIAFYDEAELSPTLHLALRQEVRGACERLTDVVAALRCGRTIDAYEGVMDVQADLRAALNDQP